MSIIQPIGKSPTAPEAAAALDKALTVADIPYDVMDSQPSAESVARLTKAEKSFDKVSDANASFLKGEVSDDVWDQVQRRAAESTALQGLGVGVMAGKKSARDLGLQSLNIKQQGMQTEAALGQAYGGLAQSYETMRQFDSAFSQSAEQLRQSAVSQSLTSTGMALDYAQFRSTLTNNINTMITDLTKFRETAHVDLISRDKTGDYGSVAKGLDDLIAEYGEILKGL